MKQTRFAILMAVLAAVLCALNAPCRSSFCRMRTPR